MTKAGRVSDYENRIAEIRDALELMHEPGAVFEVRIPKPRGQTISGYFDNPDRAAKLIHGEDGKHTAIYITANPVKSELLARNANAFERGSQITTTDSEISRRRWFLLDLDPNRPAGISATDTELALTHELAEVVVEWLSSIGWPDPVIAESGNGVHIMYRVDEPVDPETNADFEYATKALASFFSTDRVTVDTTSFNPARVWKVYGTLSSKGSDTADRPHRRAKLVTVPENIQVVPRQELTRLAASVRGANQEEFRDMSGEFIGDMVKWLSDRGVSVTSGPRPMFGTEGQKWVIEHCPFNKAHSGPIVGLINNRPMFRCLHHSCSEFRWKEFREKIDPTFKDPETVHGRLREWCDSNATEIDNELVATACQLQKKLEGVLRALRKECSKARVAELEEHIKAEKRRYVRDVLGDNGEKGNIVGLINRTRKYQQAGQAPMYWIADFDHRVRIGTVGDVFCQKAASEDEIALMVMFHSAGDSWVKQTHCAQVITYLAQEYRVNPLKLYLKKQRWDGVKRLDTWLPEFLGTENNEYTRAIGRKWMISAAARGIDPGCQADHMLIFEGKQGIGKSQALRALGGTFYTEYSGGVKSNATGSARDMVAIIIGKLIVEMSELATLRRAEMEALKATLTTTVDDVRLAYERDARSYPRTCVFAGTTNEVGQAYIADATGARRFWPVTTGVVKPVNVEGLTKVVEKLWGEAVHAYESGEDWWTVPAELVLQQQAERQMTVEDSDPWYGKIRSALTDPDSYAVSFHVVAEYMMGQKTGQFIVRAGELHQILAVTLGVETPRQTPADIIRLQKVLRAIGFKKSRPSKGWMKSTYAFDLARDALPHLWPSIEGATKAIKFPAGEDLDVKSK